MDPDDAAAVARDRYRTLSVIVPVFNERNTVAEIIRRIRAVELPTQLEIVVVDDGSSDGSDKVLSVLQDSTVRVITHRTNRGKGAAVRTGIEIARGELVLIQDADLEYDPDDWPRLLDPVMKGKAQVVYGSRFTGERQEHAAHPLDRQPPAHARHQSAVPLDAVGHGDLLQALRPQACSKA